MKQLYYVITTLFMGILLCACEKEEVDNFPLTLRSTEWRTDALAGGEMYVYSFDELVLGWASGEGYKFRCYGNGRVIDKLSFNWTYANGRLHLQFDASDMSEDHNIASYDEGSIAFTDGTRWTSYVMQSDTYDLWAGSTIPEDLFTHPEWYEFETVQQWAWQNNKWEAKDVACVHKERGLVAIKGESKIRRCNYQKQTAFDMAGYSWLLSEGCYIAAGGSTHYVLSVDRPLIDLKDEQRVPDFVLAEPEAYGFQYKECWAQHYHMSLKYYLRPDDSAIYYNDKGAFLVPGSTNINCNIFNLWYYNRDSWSGDEGKWIFPKGTSFVYGSTSDDTEYQTLVVLETPTLERVDFPEETHNINSRGSGYVQAVGLTFTGSYVFFVYEPDFDVSKVSVTYSDSWLWTARLAPILPAESEHYTRMQLLWANSENSGSARTGYIYITVSDVKGETYSHRVTVNQQGPSGSGSGDGTGGGSNEEANLGPDWVKGTAPGYLPYYYCPNTGKTTPANPRSADITIYRNKNTGAYKAAYAGKLYNAKKGYNKITMETESHSVYDSVYKYWKTCIDKLILEFTIY